MELQSRIFGDFVELDHTQDCLVMSFSSCKLPLRDRWLNNSLLADFLAEHWGMFFAEQANSPYLLGSEIKDIVRYIVNELLDNAIKFSHDVPGKPVKVGSFLAPKVLRLYATNTINPDMVEQFQHYIQQLLIDSSKELYIRQVERNAREEESLESGLGLLSMLHDYQVRLAWKFDMIQYDPQIVTVTTMAEVPLARAQYGYSDNQNQKNTSPESVSERKGV